MSPVARRVHEDKRHELFRAFRTMTCDDAPDQLGDEETRALGQAMD